MEVTIWSKTGKGSSTQQFYSENIDISSYNGAWAITDLGLSLNTMQKFLLVQNVSAYLVCLCLGCYIDFICAYKWF